MPTCLSFQNYANNINYVLSMYHIITAAELPTVYNTYT